MSELNFDEMLKKAESAPSMDELKNIIRASAENGEDFGCACYYCEATPIDLVERGDAIPIIYIMGHPICFRCTEGGYYLDVDHVNKISKKIELIEAYGNEPKCRQSKLDKLKELL